MTKIAIDIVLLPPEEIMDKAIEINKGLNNEKIILNKNNCLPHLSLCMGVIDEENLPVASELLKNISQQFSSLTLETKKIDGFLSITGEIISGFKIEKTEQLQILHETIMQKLEPHLTQDATVEMMFPDPEPQEFNLFWINNYNKKGSFENFNPHITLGVGEVKNSLDLPIKFKASRLAICHLGNYCACRKILFETKLQ